ncbi:PepSY-like domain-containing protein (plasmid) [Hymenobacter sp. BRD128]|uniref:PepSY-like domain-containing protein n=1 Tax=Hymenobacter sp. BRD128 TaxID=2675878 RepID=UPI00156760DC|nr:PepSY-like domain-containing protein [Hymenobacter sp. BRD128]QKG59248.1 PepSY-like domain-containing protein [Hymenobacter sp. BRD128]
MKQVLILAVFALALATTTHAQTLKPAQVPAAAKATFKAKFPTVTTNTWEKEGDKFEAGFKQGGKTMSAVITPAGELLETETDMSPSQLPAPVRAKLARAYKAYQIKEAATIVRADGSTVYEAEVSKGGKAQDVLFTADGSLAKK